MALPNTNKNRLPFKAAGLLGRYGVFALPLALVIVFLYLLPLIDVLSLSVTDPELGMKNYVRLFTARGPSKVFATTLWICTISTTLSIVCGYALAYGLAAASGKLRQVLFACILIPFWISVLIRAFSWLVLLQDSGLVNETLMSMGLVSEPVAMVRNQLGVVIGMVHYLLPYAVLPLYSAMRQTDMRVIAAAKSLGASDTRTFFTVFLPMTTPGIFAATVIVFVFSLGFFITPALLGGGRVVMLSEYVSVNVLQTLRWGFAAAQATVLLVMTLIAVGVMSRVTGLQKGLG